MGRQSITTFGNSVAIGGLLLYSVFAPHSIAGGEISLAIAAAGWFIRTISSGKTGFRHTKFDLPILLFFVWTAVSSFVSPEPRISIAKIQSTCVIFLFYLTQVIVTRRTAIWLVVAMILSGTAGTAYSLYDLLRGRGVVVDSMTSDSPLHAANIFPGDAIWRVNGKRVYSVSDIDEALKNSSPNSSISLSIISHGEHVERRDIRIADEARLLPSLSGITGNKASHRFRASGWTRHYETYAEILQMVAQLAVGLALAHFANHGFNRWSKIAFAAAALLALGLALTAMRTSILAFAIAALAISWRVLSGRARVVTLTSILGILLVGAAVIYETRAQNALSLRDNSSSLRLQVAEIGASRIMLHPVFGHGMDSMHLHWQEWGFPGSDMLHLHSTPLQLAFDRGLPALFFWLWILFLFWQTVWREEKSLRETRDTNGYGLALGALGAFIGFVLSSLVNYNLGDGEVALVFWWLLGIVVVMSQTTGVALASESTTNI